MFQHPIYENPLSKPLMTQISDTHIFTTLVPEVDVSDTLIIQWCLRVGGVPTIWKSTCQTPDFTLPKVSSASVFTLPSGWWPPGNSHHQSKASTRWLTYGRWHFQMHFLERKKTTFSLKENVCILMEHLLKFVPISPIHLQFVRFGSGKYLP